MNLKSAATLKAEADELRDTAERTANPQLAALYRQFAAQREALMANSREEVPAWVD